MIVDILFLSKNRLAFTLESLAALAANTNWDLVRNIWLCDDGSTDRTSELLMSGAGCPDRCVITWAASGIGSPAGIMNRFMFIAREFTEISLPEVFAKIDNDTIAPPGWLDACVSVMEAHPELDLLGIEPPSSRVPHFAGMRRSPTPELDGPIVYGGAPSMRLHSTSGYAPCDSIGGIGLMRTKAFLENEPLKPHSTYGGFTEWQLEHRNVTKGWIVPPLKVFLLDRLPMEPWVSLSREYESKGWQRPWSKYPKDCTLWNWWKTSGELGVDAASAPPPSGAGAGKSDVVEGSDV